MMASDIAKYRIHFFYEYLIQFKLVDIHFSTNTSIHDGFRCFHNCFDI